MTFDVTFEEQNKTIDGVFGDKVVVLPNGGGGSKEEWIKIADTTLTEDVASLEFTTDINGNPFKCKRIIVRYCVPKGVQNTESWLLWFPITEANATGIRGNYYVPKNSYGFLLDSTIVKENELIHHWANGYSAGNLGAPQEILKYATDATYFTKYGIYPQQHASQFYSFVKGANLKVWGLKA